MLKYDNSISSSVDGKPIYGAQVSVFDMQGNQVVIFSDEAGTIPLSQPILTDQLGYFAFYIDDGRYTVRVMTGTVEISRTNITMVDTLTLKDRALLVPQNEDAGTLPPAGDRAGLLLGFAANGAPTALAPNSFEGPTGPANSTYTSLASFKAADITNVSANYDGDLWFFIPGDYSATPADRLDKLIVKANSTPLNQGAWVRSVDLPAASAFGAKGVISQDATAGLRAAANGANSEVILPAGNYVTSGPVEAFKPVMLTGAGASFTCINPKNADPFDNTITLVGTAANELTSVQQMFIGDPSTGARRGLNGILLLTSATGQYFAKSTFRDLSIGSGSGRAIHHIHSSPEAQGGLYCAVFENCLLRGGIGFEQSGDSNNLLHNILSGSQISIYCFLIRGASLFQAQGNNATGSGGSVRHLGGSRFRYLGNNTEHYAAGAAAMNNSAAWYFNGINETLVGGIVAENLISAFGASDATTLAYFQNCRGTVFENNVLLSGISSVTTDIYIGNECRDFRIGTNTYNRGNGDIASPNIVDQGVGTMGLVKPLAMDSGWVENGPSQGMRFYKGGDGLVRLFGRAKSGTITGGFTRLGGLPVRFRATGAEWFPAIYTSPGSPGGVFTGLGVVNSAGDVECYFVPADTTSITINATFPADGLANAFSPE